MVKFEMDIVQLQATSSIAMRQVDESRKIEKLVDKQDKLGETMAVHNDLVLQLRSRYDEAARGMQSFGKALQCANVSRLHLWTR